MDHQEGVAKQICHQGPEKGVLEAYLLSNRRLVAGLLSNCWGAWCLVAGLLSNRRGTGTWWQVCLATSLSAPRGCRRRLSARVPHRIIRVVSAVRPPRGSAAEDSQVNPHIENRVVRAAFRTPRMPAPGRSQHGKTDGKIAASCSSISAPRRPRAPPARFPRRLSASCRRAVFHQGTSGRSVPHSSPRAVASSCAAIAARAGC